MKKQANATTGQRNGLKLTLDLHSNTVSFDTHDLEYESLSVFIGHPSEFPMMKERSLKVEPGREHFIDLSATVVSSDDIEDITPAAGDRFFPLMKAILNSTMCTLFSIADLNVQSKDQRRSSTVFLGTFQG